MKQMRRGTLKSTIGVRQNLMVSTMLMLFASSGSLPSQSANAQSPGDNMRAALENTCVISGDVRRLVAFYEPVLDEKAKWSGEDYAEFATGVGVLSIFSYRAQETYIPGSAEAEKNRSVLLEFKVADVDAEYGRLQGLVTTWVKPPTTQPWGTRSIYFRDPDGNLVDFHSIPAS
jgi:uncharacterized glyoxalase superfamily protein PhnB